MRLLFTCLIFLGGLLTDAQAQAPAPTAEQMVQQLKSVPRTRSLRNLNVESSAAETPEAARPSLSLLIQFDFNSARVSSVSQQALANLSQALQSPELSQSRFVVEGHTDAKGAADYNRRLSAQRAQAVAEVLKGYGVQPDRLQALGKGSSDLANIEQPFAPENRRVRIVNLD
jgi:outer membrane protein OmpA-like peptidoglycan-associated protein